MTLVPPMTTLDALKAGQSATVIHLAPGTTSEATAASTCRAA
jgi:ferrous iron transport protein A